MLIVGDLSGIQDYLFDVTNEGGQQARRFRARSFSIQLIAECLSLRVLHVCGGSQNNLIFCGAGKFIIELPALSAAQSQALHDEHRRLTGWLLKETNAQLRLALVTSDAGGTPLARYEHAMKSLQQAKRRAWAPAVGWNPEALILPPLDTPCALCGRRRATFTEADRDTGAQLRVCGRCRADREIGKDLPHIKWLALTELSGDEPSHFPGWAVTPSESRPANHPGLLVHFAPQSGPAGGQVINRPLARHIPLRNRQPVEFVELARQARGDQLLAVLKADADSLGIFLNRLLREASDLSALTHFSREMDEFFGVTLDREMYKFEWDSIYTVFAGGDDLLLVGPWNVIFDFAGHLHSEFQRQFGQRGLTLSAAVTLMKPKRPIKQAVHFAEELLDQAKRQPAPHADSPKDQVAAFGQVWKWRDHQSVIAAGKRLADWVDSDIARRGWLQTLLRLAEERAQGGAAGAVATSRLAYFVARNFPRSNDHNPARVALRQWANRLIDDFDHARHVETIFLPTIIRYALTATRSHKED